MMGGGGTAGALWGEMLYGGDQWHVAGRREEMHHFKRVTDPAFCCSLDSSSLQAGSSWQVAVPALSHSFYHS